IATRPGRATAPDAAIDVIPDLPAIEIAYGRRRHDRVTAAAIHAVADLARCMDGARNRQQENPEDQRSQWLGAYTLSRCERMPKIRRALGRWRGRSDINSRLK